MKLEARNNYWRLQYPNGADNAAKAFIRPLAKARDDSDWQDDPEYVASWRFTHVTGGYHEPRRPDCGNLECRRKIAAIH